MRFFAKLFLCTVLVLTVVLSFAEYYTVSSSLDQTVEHQVENGLKQHQLVKYALQSAILTASNNTGVSDYTLNTIAEQTTEAMAVDLQLSHAGRGALFSNLEPGLSGQSTEEGYISYEIISPETGAARWLIVSSTFEQSGHALDMTTALDVTRVFIEAETLRTQCRRVFLIATVVGSLFILLLSWMLTRPIKRLEKASRAFAEGDYSRRLGTRSRDEIGDLTRTYNWMADTIESKIGELELAVRQREDFVANFAHELKTPMTSIIGYADTIYQKELTPGQIREAAGYIVNEGLRLESLSFKLMELITLDRQDFLLEEMEMSQLFRDVEEALLPTARKRQIELVVSGDTGYCRIEYDLFKTLLLNLMDNALKSGASRVKLSGWALGGHYVIDITDNGRGIPTDQLERITEAFYMVDKSRSRREHGAGLGLALAARIADIHSTRLAYESTEGKGTTVELTLALCAEEGMA